MPSRWWLMARNEGRAAQEMTALPDDMKNLMALDGRPVRRAPERNALIRQRRWPVSDGIDPDGVFRAVNLTKEAGLAVFPIADFRGGFSGAEHIKRTNFHTGSTVDALFRIYGKNRHG